MKALKLIKEIVFILFVVFAVVSCAVNYLQMIDGIVYGEDPRQGFVEGNTFYHPDLKFRFSSPAGWKFENLPAQVNMAPPDGKALLESKGIEPNNHDFLMNKACCRINSK
ncbi:MAG TPA: hypothetical protein ENH59_00850 [Bacteroidetes bacterium]|nr:hypothetical protein [Bacteroidota bacterium]